MNIFFYNPSKQTPRPWPNKKKQTNRSALCICSVSLISAFFVSVFFIAYSSIPKSLFSISSFSGSAQFPQCRSEILSRALLNQRFMFYAPHSGFSNQLSEFKNAILMAAILNRTLIVPPVLDHHAVALGSCPKFRVLTPSEIRVAVWNHTIELLRNQRYVSMADVVDISSLVSASAVRVIDLRHFASLLCGVDLVTLCSGELDEHSRAYESVKQCGYLLSGVSGNVDRCLFAVDEDCRTTVWTYKNGDSDGRLDSFQPDEKLKKKKKKIDYVRRRRDVDKALGHGSEAESVAILAFGSLFTAPYKGSESYIDIHNKPSSVPEIRSLIEKVGFLPFVGEIMKAGKRFASDTIKAPFLCAQLRLLDGQFKNHRESTFMGLNQKLESLLLKNHKHPIHVFVMTDLPESNWTGTYLGDLSKNSTKFKLHFLKEQDELVERTQQELASAGHGQKLGSIPMSLDSIKKMQNHCSPHEVSNVQLYIEEAVCSCASLGFVGTAGSTIADSVEMMRKFNACSS